MRASHVSAPLGLLAVVLLLLATGGPSVLAENEELRFPHLLERGFRTQPSPRAQTPRSAPVARREPDAAIKPKVDPHSFVAVIGDSLADLLATGLDEAFGENQDVAILRKGRADSGLVRADYHDWPKAAADLLASPERVTHAVILLGVNDRQTIREGETAHDPLTPRWRDLYAQRVEALLRVFTERRIPVIWAGQPPMRSEKLSADLIVLNELVRERVLALGGVYVDLWEPFVDGQNRFTPTGPDVNGQPTRLRLGDGVHFTRAGARKAAFFVERELRRLIDSRPLTPMIALPGNPAAPLDGAPALSGEQQTVVVAPPPGIETPAAPALPPRPAVGPVSQLTRIETAPDGALVAGRLPITVPEAAAQVERAYAQGRPSAPVAGRADDFSWQKPD